MSTSSKGNQGEIEKVDIIPGLGERIAQQGDTVKIKYMYYGKPDTVTVDGGPTDLILGQPSFGEGFDRGIRGMKIEGTRRLIIPANLAPPKSLVKRVLSSRSPETYDVTLLAFLDSGSKSDHGRQSESTSSGRAQSSSKSSPGTQFKPEPIGYGLEIHGTKSKSKSNR